jgi:hypothetical protein
MCVFTMHVTDYLLSPTSGAKDPMTYDRLYLVCFVYSYLAFSEFLKNLP